MKSRKELWRAGNTYVDVKVTPDRAIFYVREGRGSEASPNPVRSFVGHQDPTPWKWWRALVFDIKRETSIGDACTAAIKYASQRPQAIATVEAQVTAAIEEHTMIEAALAELEL